MSRDDDDDDDQAGPSASTAAASSASSRQRLLSLRAQVTPLALELVWASAARIEEKEMKSDDGGYNEAVLDVEDVEAWVAERLAEARIPAETETEAEAAEDVTRLVLLDCLVTTIFPPSQYDLAEVALQTLSALLSPTPSASPSRTSSAHLLVAIASVYERRQQHGKAPFACPEMTWAIQAVMNLLAMDLGTLRSTLLAWTSNTSSRTRWEECFLILKGEGDEEARSLMGTLMSLSEEWKQVGGASSNVLQLILQWLRGGNAAYKSMLSTASGGHRAQTAVIHPLELGKAVNVEGRSSQARRQAAVGVLLHRLSSTVLTWFHRKKLFSLFLSASLLGASSKRDGYKDFCTDLIHAAMNLFSASPAPESQIWRSVLLAELPLLISQTIEGYAPANRSGPMMTEILKTALAKSTQPTSATEAAALAAYDASHTSEGIKGEFIDAFYDLQLIDDAQVSLLARDGRKAVNGRLMAELQAQGKSRGVDVVTLIADDYLSDATAASDFFRRMIDEPIAAKDAGSAIIECFKTSTTVATASLDALSLVVSALLDQPAALHTILLFTSPNELGNPLRCIFTDEEVLDNLYGPGVGGDDESGMLSRVSLFSQWLSQLSSQRQWQIVNCDAPLEDFVSSTSTTTARAYSLQDLSEEELPLVSRWISELFDSDGIGDEIIRDSPPRTLMKLAPTLLHQSILAAEQGVIDVEMLKGGCSFFLQDLLSYTLPSGLTWLMRDLERIGGAQGTEPHFTSQQANSMSRSTLLVTLLSMLLLDEGCPALVLELVQPQFHQLLNCSSTTLGGHDIMDASTLEALRVKFERNAKKGLAIPMLKACAPLTAAGVVPTEVERTLSGLPAVIPESPRALRAALHPLLTRISQLLSRSAPVKQDDGAASYLISIVASLLIAHFVIYSEARRDSGRGGARGRTGDEEALADLLAAIDVLPPAGREARWIQPRVLVLSHFLRLLAHLPGMLGTSSSSTGAKSKEENVEMAKSSVEGENMTQNEQDDDLFDSHENQDEAGSVNVEEIAQLSDGAEDDDYEDGEGSRYTNLTRLCALALLRAITIDPSLPSPAVLSTSVKTCSSSSSAPVTKKEQIIAATGGNGGSGSGSRRGEVVTGITKNQRGAVWTIRTALQLLPSSLALCSAPAGDVDGTRGVRGEKRKAGLLEEDSQRADEEKVSRTSGLEARIGPTRESIEVEQRARGIVEDVVQAIWEVVIVP